MQDWVDVATLTNTKSTRGRLVARCASGLPFVFSEGMEVAFVPPVIDAPRRGTVTFAHEEGLDGGTVGFDTVKDMDTALMLVGCHVLAHREDAAEATHNVLVEDDVDVIGWEAFDVSAGHIGTVADVLEMPGQILLSIARENRADALVPAVDEFIIELDEANRIVKLDVPAGLLEL